MIYALLHDCLANSMFVGLDSELNGYLKIIEDLERGSLKVKSVGMG